MKIWKKKEKRNIKIPIMTGIIIVIICIVGSMMYLNDYYRADSNAIKAFSIEDHVPSRTLEDNTIVFESEKATKGFIFYPGGKVEYTAYIPLMEACASKGILCVLVEMPFHLAVLDINAAEGIQEMYPEIESWYIGGHSLGGSMAASYVSENINKFDGLILLGSYSVVDLSNTSLEVLSVYGSEDKVLNRKKYDENKMNLPDNFSEIILDGGCHAYFGMYGEQEGDGKATISNEQQINQTANLIDQFINKY